MNKNYVVIEADLSTKRFDAQIEDVEYRLKELDYELSHAKELKLDKRTIKEYEKEVEKLNNKLISLKKQQADVNKHDFSQIGNSIKSITKSVGRWALAVFGVRSAYMFVRNAINTISQDNEQLATDIDFMKRALAYTIEPIVTAIVNLAKTLMQYIAYIVKMWTGRDIFASANKSLKNANKQAKELKKTTFDELNILSSNTSTGGGGGATPSIGALEEGQVPEWLKWIGENKDAVIGFLTEFAIGIVAIKVASADFMALGIGIILVGIFETIKSIVDFIKDPSWDNFANILTGLSIILTGVAIAMLAVNAANPLAWIALAIAAIVALVAVIIKNWDKIKEGFKNGIQWIKDKFNSLLDFISNLWNKIKTRLKEFGAKVGEIIGSGFKSAFNGIMKVIETFLNTPIKAINKLINVINKVPGINLDKLSTVSLPRLAKGGIVNMPGKGINYAGANIAERGAEGIVPLTDTAQMELLGSAIGKYITVNLTNVTELDGRTIARKVSEVSNNTNFLLNR